MDMIQIIENTNKWKSVRVLGPKIIFIPCDKINWPYNVQKNQIISIVLRFLNLELIFVYMYIYPVKEKEKELRNDLIQTKFEK